MYKIKEVCAKTGLSEKAVRLYMKEGLIHPLTEEGINHKSYFFTDQDIKTLSGISVLRSAGFSIKDIRDMQEHPQDVSRFAEERRDILEAEIEEKKKIKDAIDLMSFRDQRNTDQLAQALQPAVRFDPSKEKGHMSESQKVRTGFFLLFLAGILIASILCGLRFGIRTLAEIYGFLGFLLAGLCVFMSFRYAGAPKRGRQLPHQDQGTVIDIVRERGFDISFARAGSSYAGTREPGIGGIWTFFFLFWGEFRWDNYYPIIEPDSGKGTFGSFYCGGRKNDWKTGDRIAFSRKDEQSDVFYPVEKGWITKKALHYFLLGLMITVLSVGCFLIQPEPHPFSLPDDITGIKVSMDSETYSFTGEDADRLLSEISKKVPENWKKVSKIPGATNTLGYGPMTISLFHDDRLLDQLTVMGYGDIYYDGYRYSVSYQANSSELPLTENLRSIVKQLSLEQCYKAAVATIQTSSLKEDPVISSLMDSQEHFSYGCLSEDSAEYQLAFREEYYPELLDLAATLEGGREICEYMAQEDIYGTYANLCIKVNGAENITVTLSIGCYTSDNEMHQFDYEFK